VRGDGGVGNCGVRGGNGKATHQGELLAHHGSRLGCRSNHACEDSRFDFLLREGTEVAIAGVHHHASGVGVSKGFVLGEEIGPGEVHEKVIQWGHVPPVGGMIGSSADTAGVAVVALVEPLIRLYGDGDTP